jgi:hypothetical protein
MSPHWIPLRIRYNGKVNDHAARSARKCHSRLKEKIMPDKIFPDKWVFANRTDRFSGGQTCGAQEGN